MKKDNRTPQQKILDAVSANPDCSRADIAKATKIDATKLSPMLRQLVADKLLSMTGNTRGARYQKAKAEKAA